jgi:hypothetical protein
MDTKERIRQMNELAEQMIALKEGDDEINIMIFFNDPSEQKAHAHISAVPRFMADVSTLSSNLCKQIMTFGQPTAQA